MTPHVVNYDVKCKGNDIIPMAVEYYCALCNRMGEVRRKKCDFQIDGGVSYHKKLVVT